jgi:hypothetical protein
MTTLDEILELEENLQLEEAFHKYQELYQKDFTDFHIWKHYYFFLWYTEVESGCINGGMKFTEKHAIGKLINPLFLEGKERFIHLAEFNFIVGYTISLFPYYYGEYEEMEAYGEELLGNATKLDPLNPEYKRAYLGSLPLGSNDKDYVYYSNLTRTTIWPKYTGKGFLNEYMREMISKGSLPLT